MESKDLIEDIDLEEGKIRIDGKWLTEDEIRYAIKMKIASDDYNVADLAVALRTLIDEMNKSQVLKLRVPKELVERLESISKEKDESVEALLRRILTDFIHSPPEIAEEAEEEPGDVDDEEEDEDYNDIEIGFGSRIVEEEPEEVEPEITVEAEPIEEVVEDIDVVEEEAADEEDVQDPEEDAEASEEEIHEEPENDMEIPDDEEVLDIDDELEGDEDPNLELEEPEESIELGEKPGEDVVPEEVTAEEPEKDDDKDGRKKMVLRRRKILRRRP